MSKDCPNGKVLNSKLVQYDLAKLGRDKMSTYATKVIQSPNASIRPIWVPKSIVTNVVGSNKSWTPKNVLKSFQVHGDALESLVHRRILHIQVNDQVYGIIIYLHPMSSR